MKQEESKWLEKAKETHRYHRIKLTENKRWTIVQTARSLRQSAGAVCEDLLIIKWIKLYPVELNKLDYRFEVLDWIRKKQKEEKTEKYE